MLALSLKLGCFEIFSLQNALQCTNTENSGVEGYKKIELNDWNKRVLVVRHPLARLHSCWKDKFSRPSDADKVIFQKYHERVRVFGNMLPEWEIGFDNFLNWLAYSGEAFSEFYNEHWGSYYKIE